MSNQSSFSTTTVIIIIAGLIVGAGGGYFLSNNSLQPVISDYKIQVEDLDIEIETLSSTLSEVQSEKESIEDQVTDLEDQVLDMSTQVSSLESANMELWSQITDLTAQNTEKESTIADLVSARARATQLIEDLEEDYNDLEDDYASLQSSYNNKVNDYNQVYSNLKTLSENVLDLYEELRSYVSLEDAIPRVINYEEILKISEKIESVTGRDPDSWDGYYKIHRYVRDDIYYTYDAEIPFIASYTYTGSPYSPVVTGFNCETGQNMIQDLEYTVEYEQGDCDDQAILEYCMIQYYREYILDIHYSLYLAHVTFNDDNAHVAVFIPVSEGRICILDPAGQYQTGSWNYITGEDADRELLDYRDHWDDNDGIKKIKLYSIDIDTGNYDLAFEGSLYETIEYFSGSN